MKRFIAVLLAAVLLAASAAGCSPGGKETGEITGCEYTETGRADGGFLSLSVSRNGREASLHFQGAAGGGSEPLDAQVAVQPDVLDRVAEAAARWGIRDWSGGASPAGREDGVTALRLTYGDGSRVFVSTADSLPEGGPAALQEIRDILFTAVTAEGRPAFGGEGAPIDMTLLAEPEPTADGGTESLSPEGQAALDALREETVNDGAVFAIACLGLPDTSGGSVASDRGYLALMLEAEDYGDLTFLADLPAGRFAETAEGRALYMILPLDPAAEISVYTGTEADEEQLMFRGDGALPLLLRCGADPGKEDVLVVIAAPDGSVTEVRPRLENGMLAPMLRGHDCSAYSRAVG